MHYGEKLQSSSEDIADHYKIVKFDGDTLPPILNALTTDNQGQKLVLEVAVRYMTRYGSLRIVLTRM